MSDSVIIFKMRGDDRVREMLNRMVTRFPEEIKRGIGESAFYVQGRVKRLLSNRVMKHRSGNLAASINSRVEVVGRAISGIVGAGGPVPIAQGVAAPKVYAKIHEFGGTIKPKKQFLTIPKPENLKPSGVTRFTMKQRPDLFVFVKSVTIPERSYLRRGLIENREQVNRLIERGVKRAVDAANRGGA